MKLGPQVKADRKSRRGGTDVFTGFGDIIIRFA